VRQKHGEARPQGRDQPCPRSPQAGGTRLDGLAGAQAGLERAAHPAHDRRRQGVYQAIGKAAGVNVLFDPDYTSKRIQVDLNNVVAARRAAHCGHHVQHLLASGHRQHHLCGQNTRAKRTELDEQAVQTFYLTNAWQQNDLNDVQTAMRNVLPQRIKVYGVQSQNAIVMRGTPDELLLAQKLINDLDKARAEVVVDIAVLEVSKNWERTLGIPGPAAWRCAAAAQLQHHHHHDHTTGTTGTTTVQRHQPALRPGPPEGDGFCGDHRLGHANLLLTDSNTKILQNPRIRATDAQKATMKIGEKIPHRHRFLPDRRGHRGGQLAGQYAVPVPGRGREYRDDAHRPLRPRCDAEDQDRGHRAERLGDHQRRDRADHQPARRDQVIRLREGEASILGGIQDKQDR
jgi:hypothetical protein